MPSWKTELRPGGQGARVPVRNNKDKLDPTAAYNIEEWMQGLEEDISEAEVRNGKASNCGTELRNVHSQCVGRRRRRHRRQGTP